MSEKGKFNAVSYMADLFQADGYTAWMLRRRVLAQKKRGFTETAEFTNEVRKELQLREA